jgi:protein involved in polysaccharide export with SLBB domain
LVGSANDRAAVKAAARSAFDWIARSLELSGERTAMIPIKKITAGLSVVLGAALATGIRAQEPNEPPPQQQRPSAPASRLNPFARDVEASTPAQSDSRAASLPFVGPPGLSEEAIRSFKELRPKGSGDEESAPEVPERPSERINPFNPFEMDGRINPLEEMDQPPASVAPPRARMSPPMASRSTTARIQQRPEYIVEPPDLLIVEVLEALPGRPISGERLVRPDGRISLGFYGEIPVAGLTLPQIKERIVLHLRKFINDDLLGLIEIDIMTGEYKKDPKGRFIVKDPRDTDRVFVDVTAYNSQNCYILGDVLLPGRLPYTGGDTVLDLVQYAGGLLPTADKSRIRLIRSFPKGSPAQVLPVDYEEITMGTDSSTNHAVLPNDRLVIPRVTASRPEGDAVRGASNEEDPVRDARANRASASRSTPELYFNRRTPLPEDSSTELKERIEALEKKLDRLIEVVEKGQPKAGGEPEEKPAAGTGAQPPVQTEREPTQAMEPPPGRRMREPDLQPAPRLRQRPRRVAPGRPQPPAARRLRREEPGDLAPEGRPRNPDIPSAAPDDAPTERAPRD